MRIKAFRALRPTAEIAHLVACVPYDTVDTEEARKLTERKPWSFLRIVRPEIDLPRGADVRSDIAYAKAAENFTRFRKKRILVYEDRPYLYLYRQEMGDHVQRGIVACCHVEDYENNLIRRHEGMREEDRKDRTRLVKRLRAHTGPIFLTYRDSPAVDSIMVSTEEETPLFDFTAHYGIKHTIWRVPFREELLKAFETVPVCYVADGHHRAAAAVTAAAEERRANPNHTGEEEYNWFLAGLFPAGQLRVFAYNRCIRDLNGMTEEVFIQKVKDIFRLHIDADPVPSAPGRISMYIGGKWYGLVWNACSDDDLVAALDVSVLQERLLGPLLGIRNPRSDSRIEFAAGIRGIDELRKRTDSGAAAVAFSMCPVTVDQIMAISDAGQMMPPKSTWFEPKLKSGLIIHTF